MLLLSDVLLRWFRAVLYGLVLILIIIRDSWIRVHQKTTHLVWTLSARSPMCRRLLSPVLGFSSREHIGTKPVLPKAVAFIFCQTLQDSKAGGDLEHVASLIKWSMTQQAEQVFLYDPRGWLQRRTPLLEKVLEKAQRRTAAAPLCTASACGTGSQREVCFHVGWPEGVQQLEGGPCLGCPGPGCCAAREGRFQRGTQWEGDVEKVSQVTGRDSGDPRESQQLGMPGCGPPVPTVAGRQGQQGSSCRRLPLWPLSAPRLPGGPGGTVQGREPVPLTVVVLSAADAYWPLDQGSKGGDGVLEEDTRRRASMEAALDGNRRARAEGETGHRGTGSTAQAGRLDHHTTDGAVHTADAETWWGGDSRGEGEGEGSFGGLCAAEGRESCQEAGEQLEGPDAAASRLERAIQAPGRLRQRLVRVAGPLAGAEPELVIVCGEALTLGGYPPWALRTSEIYHAGMLGGLKESDLNRILRRYLGTRQRFGT